MSGLTPGDGLAGFIGTQPAPLKGRRACPRCPGPAPTGGPVGVCCSPWGAPRVLSTPHRAWAAEFPATLPGQVQHLGSFVHLQGSRDRDQGSGGSLSLYPMRHMNAEVMLGKEFTVARKWEACCAGPLGEVPGRRHCRWGHGCPSMGGMGRPGEEAEKGGVGWRGYFCRCWGAGLAPVVCTWPWGDEGRWMEAQSVKVPHGGHRVWALCGLFASQRCALGSCKQSLNHQGPKTPEHPGSRK